MEWISVEDKMPQLIHINGNTQYSDRVLVTNGKAVYMSTYFGVHGWLESETDIIAWMPLPSPPKQQ